MSKQQPVGLTKGPGATPREFTFVSQDRDYTLKSGEFVVYHVDVDDQDRTILARITKRQPLRVYPDAFLSDPGVNPDDVAGLLGYRSRAHELFEVSATVIGYYDGDMGDFIDPRVPPRLGLPIYLATDAELTHALNKKRKGDVGAAHIGSLLDREKDRVPIVLDLRAITSTHLVIVASTGSGKSYLAAALVEEMMKPNNRAAVLIVDPHSEYGTLAEMVHLEAFVEAAYRPEVQVFRPGQVKVRASALTLEDLCHLLPDLSEKMEYLLRRAYYEVRQRSQEKKHRYDRWTLEDLETCLRELAKGGSEEKGERYGSTADALIWRLKSVLERSTIFDDSKNANLPALFRPGRCSILQLNEVDEREQQVMVATILRRLFRARLLTTKGRVRQGSELCLPFPVFVLIEEAHRFAPATGDVVSKGILKQVLSEGRKFGLAVGLVSQRPGKLDGDVLSLCGTQFILRVVNPLDQARLAESVETVGREQMDELPALSKGQVVIAGEAVSTPLTCRVRFRYTPHGAETKDAPAEWMTFFDQGGAENPPLSEGEDHVADGSTES